jgi:hypothetical protein
MTFDLLSMAEVTASTATVVVTLVVLFGQTLNERAVIAGALISWFAAVLAAGASGILQNEGGLGTPGLGATVALALTALTLFGLGRDRRRARILEAPLPALIAVQAVRALGVSFILLYFAGRLPAPFAPTAGWGDIFIGVTALPMAYLAARAGDTWRGAIWLWNSLGLLDLVVAVGLGATSAPGPLQLFSGPPGSAIMTTLPWIVIPCFLVPALAFVHLAIFYRLGRLGATALTTRMA